VQHPLAVARAESTTERVPDPAQRIGATSPILFHSFTFQSWAAVAGASALSATAHSALLVGLQSGPDAGQAVLELCFIDDSTGH